MKKNAFLFAVCFAFFIFGQSKQDYYMNWDGISSILKVKLIYTAEKDSTVFEFASEGFGGQTDIFKVVKNIHGAPSDQIKINEKERKITIYHTGRHHNTLYYEIDGAQPDYKKPSIYTELFRPVITKGYLSFVNDFFMMKPIGESNSDKQEINIIWEKFPKKYSYFNSVEPMAAPNKKLKINRESFGRLLFVMGDKIAIKKYNVKQIPYYSITSTEEQYKDLETKLPPFFKDYFPNLRKFWEDNKAPFYFVAVLPLKYAGKTRGGGFGMDNGFMMKYLGDFTSWEKEVIAHETSHNWIGIKMMLGNDSFDHQWFGEGFNDYVTIINLARSKVFSKEEFLDYLNKDNFKEHYTSPVKDSTNASIAKNYWTDYKNFGKLPYRRGLIYAFYLDNQIRLASNGKFTLRNFLLDIFKGKQIDKNPDKNGISLDEFINLGSNYIPKEQLQNEIDTYMIRGKPIDFKTVKLIPEFQIEFENGIPQVKLAEKSDLTIIYNW